MRSLIFNFIKRSVLVPVVVTAAVLALLLTLGGRAATASQAKLTPAAAAAPDLSGYSSSLYDSFEQLTDGALIGTLSGLDGALSDKVVCYQPTDRSQLAMAEGSTAPWNGGAMLITGTDTENQLAAMHRAKVGSDLTLTVIGRDTYPYTVTRIDAGVTEENLASYLQENTLVVAFPYKNLAVGSNADLYIVCIAEPA